ncbi:MAG TPA: YdbL family protein [Croceibacterium sp.]|nr:YdbL family protein [Croceibacterium sp.]
MNRTLVALLPRALVGGFVLAGLAVAAPALAQRDPAYDAARQAGQVGEKMDGYLGVVGDQPAAVRDLVSNINIRRRANYAERAQAAQPPATLQEYAFTQGCILIARLENGLKYQTPDGGWETKNGTARRDPRCP